MFPLPILLIHLQLLRRFCGSNSFSLVYFLFGAVCVYNATEPDPYAIALLKKFSAVSATNTVRPTPDGIIFDIERDWLRDDAEVFFSFFFLKFVQRWTDG